MTVSQGALAPVLVLPAAAPFPVLNPRWRGRYPAGVVRMRTELHPGYHVAITRGRDRGVLGVIESVVDAPPGEDRTERWFRVRAIHGLFYGCVNALTNEPSEPTATLLVPASCLSRRLASAPIQDQRFALPAWPRRWEQALARSSVSH